MATGQITSDTNGPIIEAVVGAPLVDKIYKLQVGDTLSIQSGILTPPISIKIVGIAEMLDDDYDADRDYSTRKSHEIHRTFWRTRYTRI